MSREARDEAAALRFVLQFIRGLTNFQVAEQVYAAALDVVQGLFTPDRGFIALSEFVVPIYLGDTIAGRIMLQYDKPRLFTEGDFALIEIIAAQSGFALQRIQ